jgi:hypothetical protein
MSGHFQGLTRPRERLHWDCMIPPTLHHQWQRRVIFDPQSRSPHVESFFIKANDPRHDRAFWLRLTLTAIGAERYAETWAIFVDRHDKRRLVAKERHDLRRVNFDPERAGLGVGLCAIEDNHSHGVVKGDDFSVSWDFELDSLLPEYLPLPSAGLYKSRWLSSKTCTPNPSAALHGRLELWEAKKRHAGVEVINLEGWRGMQGHNWGKHHEDDYAWTHCNLFDDVEGPAFFEGMVARPSIAGLFSPQVLLGRLVVGGQTYRFDTWSSVRHGVTQNGSTRWSFAMQGPDGKLKGEVEGTKADMLGVSYTQAGAAPIHCLNTKLAQMTLTLEPHDGAKRVLTSGKAAFEVGTRDPNHGVQIVLS